MNENKRLIADLISLVGAENALDSIYEQVSYGQEAAQSDLDPERVLWLGQGKVQVPH